MQQYVDLVNRVLREGEPRADRTGVGTLAVFGGRIEFDLRERYEGKELQYRGRQ